MTTVILVIDDDNPARRMMRRALERRGYTVLDAADGRSGLTIIQQQNPDAVLLDMRMPGELSGEDVARLVRADEQLRELPVIIVSASVHQDARELIDTLDCNAFVEKPVDFTELFETLERVLSERSSA